MRKPRCGAPVFGIFYVEKGVLTWAIYTFSNLCVVSLWRNNTFSMHMLTRKNQWVMMAKPPSRKVSVCRLVSFTRKVFTSCWADGFQICWS